MQEAALKRLMAALLGAVPMILGTPVSRSATTIPAEPSAERKDDARYVL